MADQIVSKQSIVLMLLLSCLLSCRSRGTLIESDLQAGTQSSARKSDEAKVISATTNSPLAQSALQRSSWVQEAESALMIGRLTYTRSANDRNKETNSYEQEAMQWLLSSLNPQSISQTKGIEQPFVFQKCIDKPGPIILDQITKISRRNEPLPKTAAKDAYTSAWANIIAESAPSKQDCADTLISKSRLDFQFFLITEPGSVPARSKNAIPTTLRQALVISSKTYDKAALLLAADPLPKDNIIVYLRGIKQNQSNQTIVIPSHRLFSPIESYQAYAALNGSAEQMRIARKDPLVDLLYINQPESLIDLNARYAIIQHWQDIQNASFEKPDEKQKNRTDSIRNRENPKVTWSLIQAFAGRPFAKDLSSRFIEGDLTTNSQCGFTNLPIDTADFEKLGLKDSSPVKQKLLENLARACQVSDQMLALSHSINDSRYSEMLNILLQDVYINSLALVTLDDFSDVNPKSPSNEVMRISETFAANFLSDFLNRSHNEGPNLTLFQDSIRNASLKIKETLEANSSQQSIQ